MIDKPREIALKTLYNIEENQAYSNIELNKQINQSKKELTKTDIGFISEIVYGVITWKLTLDEIIKKHSNIKLKKISPWIKNILRMGIYQIIFLEKVPKSAAVNESVNLAKRYGHKASYNFVNAILRKVENKDYEELFEIKNDVERISKTTSMPQWIVEELLNEYSNSIQEVEEICKNSNLRPQISIRVNKLKTKKEELKEKLKQHEMQRIIELKEKQQGTNQLDQQHAEKIEETFTKQKLEVTDGILEDFLVLKQAKNIEEIQEFKEGKFTVQDEVAGLTAIILEPKPGEYVLDACSSPGGKTTYLAEIMENIGKIEAWDIHEHRVKLVENAAKRLGITIINTKVQDATIEQEQYYKKFDKILLDVPCLGIGVLKRKPDIKWQRKKEDIEEITKTQEKILSTCSKYLKEGGSIVYSTCSIFKKENEEIVNKFIKNNPEFNIEELNLKNEKFFEKYIKYGKYLQVFQNEKTDGFFICKINRKTI